ncbi:MAG TPA: hypothetical protein VF655_13775 [Allosphingosinicella sp.]|jgi:hypothetical protein
MISILFPKNVLLPLGRSALAEFPHVEDRFFGPVDAAVGVTLASLEGHSSGCLAVEAAVAISGLNLSKVAQLFESLSGTDPERHLWSDLGHGRYSLLVPRELERAA